MKTDMINLRLFLGLFSWFLSTTLSAQKNFVRDAERIFSAGETAQLDSSLRAFHERTGKFVIVVTDTADVAAKGYADAITRQYVPDSTEQIQVLELLFSRTHSLVFISVNRPLVPYINDETIRGFIDAGIPLLREKKPGAAAFLITEKAMNFLDRLRE